MNKRIATLMIAGAGFMWAQQPPMGGPNHGPGADAIRTHLNLTDSQMQSIERLNRQRDLAHQSANEQIRQKETTLRDLLQKGASDAATVGKLVLEIEALRKSVGQIDTDFRDQARNTLTADQKTRLKALDDGATLLPAIQQAIGLHLVTPPNPPQNGPMQGPRFGPGPGMQGMPGIRGGQPPQGR